ncbi:c-type cytochrome [Pseudothauera lacus]|uniref:Cytochrome C n=1 Tax=Pseudothauera lacus TaxID=2136175 RepID=A0A2T4IE66_9RHOO|nr:c-type cytochrome [Pseudothauera lacus]PTD96054.1 cytochrome C [Pseudothauera lacus]
MKLKFALATVCALAAGGLAHAQDPNLARNLAATCANCHGTNGKSVGGMDSLAGEPRDKLLQKMLDFKSGAKPASIMHQISKGYTDEQLELIAAYFAAQK